MTDTNTLTLAERLKKADEVRKETLKDLMYKLKKFGKCALIRPTGWGKTWLLARLIKNYKKVLYVYPTQVIADTVNDRLKKSNTEPSEDTYIDPETIELIGNMEKESNVTMLTYQKLAISSPKELVTLTAGCDLIIFDESHRMCAPKASLNIKYILQINKKTKVIGATATPTRGDDHDFVTEFFDNIATYPYTAHDSFEDGIFLKPHVCCFTTDMKLIENDLKEAALTAGEDFYNMYIKEVIKSNVVNWARMHKIDKEIKNICTQYADTNCMKFICFFATCEQLDKKSEEVKKWFHKAFPKHKIETLIITSRTDECANTELLETLGKKNNTIYLICTINMLNLGYHVKDLTGIIMYRGTTSDIIYVQQMGRCFSATMENACIVFDIVDNTHRKALWVKNKNEEQQSRTKKGYRSKPHHEDVATSIYIEHDLGGYEFIRHASDEEKLKFGAKIETHFDKQYILLPDEYFDPEESTVKIKWWLACDTIYEKDIEMVGLMASYPELIAKLVGESLSKRCLDALELHFKRFCREKEIPFPIEWDALREQYGYDKQDVINELIKLIKNTTKEYPIGDAKKIMTATSIPLDTFAKWKNVSIRNILKILGIEPTERKAA